MSEMKLRDEYLLFLDLETTGTDPEKDVVLEVGCVFVHADTLERVWQQTSYIELQGTIDDLAMSDYVRDMHTKNGLLQGLRENSTMEPRYTLEKTLRVHLSWIFESIDAEYSDFYAKPWIRLAGYSPQFDRQFLLRDAPHFSQLLSHRMMDVSSLRAAAKVWCPSLVTEQEVEHRALADCIAAIEELKTYRTVFETHGK